VVLARCSSPIGRVFRRHDRGARRGSAACNRRHVPVNRSTVHLRPRPSGGSPCGFMSSPPWRDRRYALPSAGGVARDCRTRVTAGHALGRADHPFISHTTCGRSTCLWLCLRPLAELRPLKSTEHPRGVHWEPRLDHTIYVDGETIRPSGLALFAPRTVPDPSD